MPRMTLLTGLVASLLLAGAGASAQTFTDQGMLSGSGMSVLPTASIVPSTEFRLQVSRVDFLGSAKPGMNVFGVGLGLSSTIEGYVRVTGEQLGQVQSQIAYGFGGKIRIPLLLPVVRRAALWVERSTTDQDFSTKIFTAEAVRAGVIVTADSNGIHPTFLAGVTRIGNLTRPLVGAGMTIAAGSASQLSFELLHGYLGRKSFMAAGTLTHRLFRNITFHASPGYLTSPNASTWTISVGVSLATADIDFHPADAELDNGEFVLPSIEEMERGTALGWPTSLDSTSATGSQSSTLPETMDQDGVAQPNLPLDGPAIDGPKINEPLMDGPSMEQPAIDGPAGGEPQPNGECNLRGRVP